MFGASGDPIKLGLVSSLNRPGGNVTGVSFLNTILVAKQFEVLHELVPHPAALALLVNPTYQNTAEIQAEAQRAAVALGRDLFVAKAATESDLEEAFAAITQRPVGGLLVGPDPFFDSQAARIIALAAKQAMPATYALREFAAMGGLTSYGTRITEAFRLVGNYTGRILKGEKPGDLPAQQLTKVELIVNLKTAKTLGLTVPPSLLARADEVIE